MEMHVGMLTVSQSISRLSCGDQLIACSLPELTCNYIPPDGYYLLSGLIHKSGSMHAV